MPKQTVENLVLKVLLNQIILGPIVIAVVFAWNNLWQGKISELPNKYKKDALPTLFFGFRLWIPVGVLNFGFAISPLSPMELGVLNEMARVINGRPRQYIPQLPPRFTKQQWMNMQVPTQEEEQSRLSPDESKKKAIKMSRKKFTILNQKPQRKHLAQRSSSDYKDTSYATNNSFVEKEKVEDEEGKRCGICLMISSLNSLVTLTPSNHMFHEECIVPWVKSHGQCPVCLLIICKPMGCNAMPLNNNYRM
ncbi:E3 ubiquitin-protein ligase RNF130 [Camellia lanceoleosa]|nr:E3 ubiquitin-protein ligase RNF130 [Camellia lanceoleosa]